MDSEKLINSCEMKTKIDYLVDNLSIIIIIDILAIDDHP